MVTRAAVTSPHSGSGAGRADETHSISYHTLRSVTGEHSNSATWANVSRSGRYNWAFSVRESWEIVRRVDS